MTIGDRALSLRPMWRWLAPAEIEIGLPSKLGSLGLRNPVGLAAGLDKRCQYLDSLGDLGFGYVIGGTVTRFARQGNMRPRLLRLAEPESLINALGFPGDGLDLAVSRLQRLQHRPARVLVSVAALDEQDVLDCVIALEPIVDGIELNISSPNTAGLRRFQETEPLRHLLELVNEVRRKPLFVKLPQYVTDAQQTAVLSIVRVCREVGVDGVTAANTVPVDDERLAVSRGGLSGRAILTDMLRVVPEIRSELGATAALNACGGIASAEDALAALESGADTVQLYTALVFRGPALVAEICKGLRANALYSNHD